MEKMETEGVIQKPISLHAWKIMMLCKGSCRTATGKKYCQGIDGIQDYLLEYFGNVDYLSYSDLYCALLTGAVFEICDEKEIKLLLIDIFNAMRAKKKLHNKPNLTLYELCKIITDKLEKIYDNNPGKFIIKEEQRESTAIFGTDEKWFTTFDEEYPISKDITDVQYEQLGTLEQDGSTKKVISLHACQLMMLCKHECNTIDGKKYEQGINGIQEYLKDYFGIDTSLDVIDLCEVLLHNAAFPILSEYDIKKIIDYDIRRKIAYKTFPSRDTLTIIDLCGIIIEVLSMVKIRTLDNNKRRDLFAVGMTLEEAEKSWPVSKPIDKPIQKKLGTVQ